MITFENISKSFKTKTSTVHALQDITLKIEKGDIFGVIGFSGAGKSTLIRMVNALEKPDSGTVIVNGKKDIEGALSVIGAVSPPGGDISEPVSQATLRIVKVFWGLDASLAYKRHFPAINWLTSYSLYTDQLQKWYEENASEDFIALRGRLMSLLQDEAELQEIVNLVGMDALSASDRLKLETARAIREDYLHQNAFDPTDTYTSLKKQVLMMRAILLCYDKSIEALKSGADINLLVGMLVRERIGRFKYESENQIDQEFESIKAILDKEISDVLERSED